MPGYNSQRRSTVRSLPIFNCVVLCIQLCCSMYSIVMFYVFNCVVLCIQLCCSMYSIMLFYVFNRVVLCIQLCCSMYCFNCVVLYIVFVDCVFLCSLSCKCVPYYCQRMSTQLQLNISYHTVSQHITSHHIISHNIKSHNIISHHIISYIISYHIISNHITSHHIISYHNQCPDKWSSAVIWNIQFVVNKKLNIRAYYKQNFSMAERTIPSGLQDTCFQVSFCILFVHGYVKEYSTD
jgi:hypothetical protein